MGEHAFMISKLPGLLIPCVRQPGIYKPPRLLKKAFHSHCVIFCLYHLLFVLDHCSLSFQRTLQRDHQ